MVTSSRTLAVIPARGGSKRLPNKNLLSFADKPLIAHTIEASLTSKEITDVCVSSDSNSILASAAAYPELLRVRRPHSLATDIATTVDVVLHALKVCEERTGGIEFDNVVVLQPTSPLRRSEHIDEAIGQARQKEALSMVSVCPAHAPRAWISPLGPEQSMQAFVEALRSAKRSQDYEQEFVINGALYVVNRSHLVTKKSLFSDNACYAYIMRGVDSIDIDDADDFFLAEAAYQHRDRTIDFD